MLTQVPAQRQHSRVTPKKFFEPAPYTDTQLSLDLVTFIQNVFDQDAVFVDVLGVGGEEDSQRVRAYSKLPTLAQFCRSYGITQSELKRLALKFPDTIGRAYEYALDAIEDLFAERTLDGHYNPAAAAFIGPNITRFRNKQQIEAVVPQSLSSVLDEIEAARQDGQALPPLKFS